MIRQALVSALHLSALALGFASVVARGMRLRDLRRSPGDTAVRASLLRADNVWGIAALLWLSTGLYRLLAGVDKTPAFYMRNGFFALKMGLFLLVFALEIVPMVTFVRWRLSKGGTPAGPPLDTLIRLNDAEVALVLAIPFTAAFMARGVWLF